MALRILLAAVEAYPLAKAGGLGDVAGSLPKALAALGHEVNLIMPRYRWMEAWRVDLGPFNVPMGEGKEVAALKEGNLSPQVPVLMVDHLDYFARDRIYGYKDDGRRFAFFSRALLEACRHVDFRPDVIHCHDWHTALVPAYLRAHYAQDDHFANTRTLLTIHNLNHQGKVPAALRPYLDLPEADLPPITHRSKVKINLLQAGIRFADAVSTVSPSYAKEIQTAAQGHGLHGDLRGRARDLYGVLNGLDLEVWDPTSDPFLAQPYDPRKARGKEANKRALQREVGLPPKRVPLLGFIARLVPQKGVDLLLRALPTLAKRRLQLIVLGTGKPNLETALRAWVGKHRNVSIHLTYDEGLAHRIYAGADLFLMPSKFEPCGLGQMISMRYGTVPVARRTGGLADTVVDADQDLEGATGFTFEKYAPRPFLQALDRALAAYGTKGWKAMVANGVRQDFSWDQSAGRYQEIFEGLTAPR